MIYTLILEDDNGEVLYKERTQLYSVAEIILGRMLEIDKSGVSAPQVRDSIYHWCEDCGDKFTPNKSQTMCDYCYDEMQADHQALEINEAQHEAAQIQD